MFIEQRAHPKYKRIHSACVHGTNGELTFEKREQNTVVTFVSEQSASADVAVAPNFSLASKTWHFSARTRQCRFDVSFIIQ